MNAVIDANALSFYFIPNPAFTPAIEEIIEGEEARMHAPPIWESEMRSVLMKYVRSPDEEVPGTELMLREAIEHMADAKILVMSEHAVDPGEVLRLAHQSSCSTYDCEYVHLADRLKARLITWDKQVLMAFPDIAISPEDFVVR